MGTAVIRPSTLARLAKRAPKDAEPELHSLASYLGDMMFVFYAVWRVGLLTVFMAVVLPLFGLWRDPSQDRRSQSSSSLYPSETVGHFD